MTGERKHRGQRYRFCGTVPHRKADGSVTTLDEWETDCADCGAAFRLRTTAKWEPTKRCEAHRKPGCPA